MYKHTTSRIQSIIAFQFTRRLLALAVLSSTLIWHTHAWGFFAHKEINEKAIFLLPTELLTFYKQHLDFIREEAVKPDKRRYIVEGEASCHYIDVESYKQKNPNPIPLHEKEAIQRYSQEFLNNNGILPWHIARVKRRLTHAFKEKNYSRILRLSADIGHYIADAHVPLHTTKNYNGQLTDQHGIHALWESRLPELFASQYNFLFKTKATYIKNVPKTIGNIIRDSHQKSIQVLAIEKKLDATFPSLNKYCFEERGTTLVRTYTQEYAGAYHNALNNMVQQQMRDAILMVASVWLTCWIDAGCPQLNPTQPIPYSQNLEKISPEDFLHHNIRPHE